MKHLFILVLCVLIFQSADAQSWQVGVRSGVGQTFHTGPAYYINPPVWDTELFLRREKNKWAFEIAAGHYKYTRHTTMSMDKFFGPSSFSAIDITTNNFNLTGSFQRQILSTKNNRLRNYIGLSGGMIHRIDKYNAVVIVYNNETPPSSEEWSQNEYYPTLGINYYLSYNITRNVNLNMSVRPALIFDWYYKTTYSDTYLSGMIGFSCKL